MDNNTKKELLLHGIRWSNNILVQMLSDYGHINSNGRDALRKAIQSLNEAEHAYRTVHG